MTATTERVPFSELAVPRATKKQQLRLPYLPGLDGIRAIAVSAVLVFHLPSSLLPGGFLGVDVFFVLSGFLITTLLLNELEGTGTIRFRNFYLRRARRLLPALLAVLVFTALIVLTLARDSASQFRGDLLSALSYTTNWWYIFDHQSYFEAIGRPPMLLHLWSLAIEEQFYVVWPSIMFLAWRRWGRRGVGVTALVGALASTAWMTTIAFSEDVPAAAETARLYFGSDTHAMTVLVGALLACVWNPSRLPTSVTASTQRVLSALGWTALVALAWFFISGTEQSGWLFRGGFLLVAVVAAAVVLPAAHPASRFGVALGNPVMRWVGTRSYGIYLWHWPVFMVTRPDLDLPYGGLSAALTSLVLTGLLAEASFRWIETPVRRGELGAAWRRARRAEPRLKARWVGSAAALVTVAFAGGAALAAVPTVTSGDFLDGVTSVGAGDLRRTEAAGSVGSEGSESDKPDRAASDVPLADRSISAVGDSVLLSARTAIQQRLPRARFDAEIGRQPYDLIDRVLLRERVDALANVVIIQTGTNGIPDEQDLRGLLVGLADRERVLVVNSRASVPWMEKSNQVIDTATRAIDNVVVVDWAASSAGHGEYFVADGTHLTPQGSAAYARGIAEALR